MLQYTYKLYKDDNGELLVTVKPLMNDVEKSIHAMMELDVSELSEENKHLVDLKILGLKTIHQFLGALLQEQQLKELSTELRGRINIKVDEQIDALTKTVH